MRCTLTWPLARKEPIRHAVQNTDGVSGIHVVPTASLRQQMDAVLSDIGADVVKTGMLPDVQVRPWSRSTTYFQYVPFLVHIVCSAS